MKEKFLEAKPKIDKPQFAKDRELALCTSADILTTMDDDVSDTIFDHVDFSQAQFLSGNIDRCKFVNCDFFESKLDFSSFTDCIFTNCNMANCDWQKLGLNRTVFSECKFTGGTIADSYLSETTFEKCIGDMLVMSGNKMRDILMSDCNFSQLAFYDCKPIRLKFSKCTLKHFEIQEVVFEGVDFSDSDLSGGRFLPACLRSCQISSEQSAMIASMLGLWVK